MFDACLPLGPIFASKVTFCPSARLLNPSERISEKCANRSSPPSSGVMNPKPFASLNHLTVPVAIDFPVLSCAGRAAVAQRERAVDRHDEPLFGTRQRVLSPRSRPNRRQILVQACAISTRT